MQTKASGTMDLPARKHQNKKANKPHFETLLAEITTNFINLPVDQIDAAIMDSQRCICEFLGVDRSVLWQFIDDIPQKTQPSHIHDTSEDLLPNATYDFKSMFPNVYEHILQGEIFTVTHTKSLQSQAERDCASFKDLGIKSSLMAPLLAAGNVIGALSFCSLQQETQWPEDVVQRLNLVTQLFSSALSRKQTEEQLTSLKEFETLVTEISAHFSNLPVDQIDAQIEDAQKRVCECLKVDLSALWQWSKSEPHLLTLTHLHSPPDGPERPEDINANDAFPWSLKKMSEGKPMVIYTENMPAEAARDQEMRRHFGVKSSVGIPLSVGKGPIIGFISFDTLKTEPPWPKPIVARLQLIGQVFANALIRKQSAEHLEALRRFESLVTEISTLFVHLPTEQIDAQIEKAQRRICECLDIDLSVLWQWSDASPHFMTVTHLHTLPDGPQRPDKIDAKESFPWALEKMQRGEVLAYSTDSMPPEAARDQESRRHFGIKSSVVIPLSTGGGPLMGILTFDTLKRERSWSQQTVEKLCLIAEIFTNMLSRKRAELKLRENQRRLNMATDSAGMGLWVMDLDTKDVWVTPQTRTLFNFTEDEVLDQASFNRMIHPADRQQVDHAVDASIQSGEPLNVEFRVVHLDGSVHWIHARGRRLLSRNGDPVRFMGASVDVSGRKQMEKQLQVQLKEIKSLKQQLEQDNIQLRKEIELQHVHEEIVSRSPIMKRILAQVEQVALTDATVLIEGETGTGKELLARAVHRLGNRKDRPLVTVNCASLPPTLVESELFGREKGAYTGALTRMTGRFEIANGATLFLDEIGELPLDVQAKLLRVLEQGIFERLGSTKSMTVDARIIAATNQNLKQQVDAGKFRKDLYYRLNVFPIHIPPLKERPEDIPLLVWTFVRQYETKMGRRIDQIPHQCMDELQRYSWPGNVRELRNLIERALIVCNSRTLELHPPSGTSVEIKANQYLTDIEREHIVSVLHQTGWRISGSGGAAGILGLKRTTLQSKMKKLGIQRPKKK